MSRKPSTLSSDEFETVAELRVALRRFQAATDRITAANGLTPRQYDLLAVLHAHSRRGALASEIADELAISRNAMTELISRAERAGLVVRGGDSMDARRKPLGPTALGTKRFRAAVLELGPEREMLLKLLGEPLARPSR